MPKTLAGLWNDERVLCRAQVGAFVAYVYPGDPAIQTHVLGGGCHSAGIIVPRDDNRQKERAAIIAQGKELCEADFQEYRQQVKEEAEALGFTVTETEQENPQ